MKVIAPGKRYYPDEMTGFAEAKAAIGMLCDVKIRAYECLYDRSFNENSKHKSDSKSPVYDDIRSFGLKSVYASPLANIVNGILKSQVSNQKNYIEKLEDDISSMYDKLNEKSDELLKKQSVKDAIVVYAKSKGKTWIKPYPSCSISIDGDGILSGFGVKAQDYRVYERKVESDIRKIKGSMSRIFEGILRREQKLKKLEDEPPKRAIFGSRRLYKKKDTTCETEDDRKLWKEEFYEARHSKCVIGGRCDSPYGNHIVKRDESGTLLWELPDGTYVAFPDYSPRNYTKEYEQILSSRNASKTAIGYTFEVRKDTKGREFILVWAAFDYPDDGRRNYYIMDGVIAVDINADCLAWSELDGEGNRVDGSTIPMELAGLSSNQAKDVIGRAVRILTTQCKSKYKPLVCEKLDSRGMRKKQKYGNKKKNRIVSQFAFAIVLQTIESQAQRIGIEIIRVNPAYTSFIGKVAYMRKFGTSIHESASYVIGLLGMGIYPDIPEVYEPLRPKEPNRYMSEKDYFYYIWRPLYKALSGIRKHAFYLRVEPQKNKRAFQTWFKKHDIIRPPNSFFSPEGRPASIVA